MKTLLIILGALGVVAGFFAMLALSVAWSGYALSILWGWFMVPTLSLPAISIPAAIGLSLVAHLVSHQDQSRLAKEPATGSWWMNAAGQWATILLIPAVSLLIGWIVKGYL